MTTTITHQDTQRLYRVAGLGGVVAALAWTAQPLLVALVAGASGDGLSFAYIQAHPWTGALEAATFAVVGLGLLTLVSAVDALAGFSRGSARPELRVGHALGLSAGVAWLLLAGLSLAPYTSVGFFLGEAVPEPTLQGALYQLLGVVQTGIILFYAIAFIAWLFTLAIAGRRAGVVGWPLAIGAIATAAVMAAQLLMPFAPPWGTIAGLGYTLVLGIRLMLGSRRQG